MVLAGVDGVAVVVVPAAAELASADVSAGEPFSV